MMPEIEERKFNITQDALTDLIEYLKEKARHRISREMQIEFRQEIESKEHVAIACMPHISLLKLGPDLKLEGRTMAELQDYFEGKLFNYFYAEIFDYMKAMQHEIQSKEAMQRMPIPENLQDRVAREEKSQEHSK